MKDWLFVLGLIGLGLVMLAVIFAGPIMQAFAPCSWLGWMSISDAPLRCVGR